MHGQLFQQSMYTIYSIEYVYSIHYIQYRVCMYTVYTIPGIQYRVCRVSRVWLRQPCSWSAEPRKAGFFLCPRSRPRIWSRETGSAVPSRVSLLILHPQAESGAYSRDFSRFPRRRLHIPPTAIGSVPSLSGHATLRDDAARLFSFVLFSLFSRQRVSGIDWPPCKVVFSGWQPIRRMRETSKIQCELQTNMD